MLLNICHFINKKISYEVEAQEYYSQKKNLGLWCYVT